MQKDVAGGEIFYDLCAFGSWEGVEGGQVAAQVDLVVGRTDQPDRDETAEPYTQLGFDDQVSNAPRPGSTTRLCSTPHFPSVQATGAPSINRVSGMTSR